MFLQRYDMCYNVFNKFFDIKVNWIGKVKYSNIILNSIFLDYYSSDVFSRNPKICVYVRIRLNLVF